jgi:ankyrin repeat protein
MNVLLIYYIFFNVVVFTSASTNIASVSKKVENEPAKTLSLHEWTFTSLADQVPFPSFYYILRFASERRMIDLMRGAIDSGKFDVNAVIRGSTALHRVCIGRQNPEMAVDAAKLLVANGANINALDYWNNSALHHAVKESNFELVEYILSENAQTEFHDSILVVAMNRCTDDSRIVKALIQTNPRLLDTIEEFLNFASMKRMVDLMRIAINSGKFDINAGDEQFDNSTALHCVCVGTQNPEMALDAAKLLVESGANINALNSDYYSPLHYAVMMSNIELVEYLLSVGAQTEFRCSILELAMTRCTDSRILKALIEFNPRLLDSTKELLHFASDRGDVNLMRIAIDSGKFDINAVHREWNKLSALHCVCLGIKNPEMAVDAAKLLVENGANIDALDRYSCTPLYYAVKSSNIVLVEYLKSKGAAETRIL